MVLLQLLRGHLPNGVCLKFWKCRKDDLKDDEPVAATEEELRRLDENITRLLERLSQYDSSDVPASPDEECLICVTGRASVHTFPCGHIVLCRKCFIRTIQVAVSERNLPLRCVLCRSRVARLKQVLPRRTTVRQPPTPGTVPLNPSSNWSHQQ